MTLQGSPPVREFHPPPKVTQQAIPQKDHGSKERNQVTGPRRHVCEGLCQPRLLQYDQVQGSEPDRWHGLLRVQSCQVVMPVARYLLRALPGFDDPAHLCRRIAFEDC